MVSSTVLRSVTSGSKKPLKDYNHVSKPSPSACESFNPGSPLPLHLQPDSNTVLREGLSLTSSFSLKAADNG